MPVSTVAWDTPKTEMTAHGFRTMARGHWEGDLFFGSHNGQIATLVERQTRYLMLVRVAAKDSETVVNALIKQAHKLPRELYKSLTWVRGSEMAEHKRFSLSTDVKVYFCDPQQPWQRGTPTDYSGSTSRKEWICRASIRSGSTRSRDG
jgi:IS30 family transposase